MDKEADKSGACQRRQFHLLKSRRYVFEQEFVDMFSIAIKAASFDNG